MGLALGCCSHKATRGPGGPTSDWAFYGGDAGGSRYSPLTEINRGNVAALKVAWVYHAGDVSDGSQHRRKSAFEATPIVVDGLMYVTTAFNRVIALDPETGRERWHYDPKVDLTLPYGDGLINRGVATWLDPDRSGDQACHRRIFEATLDGRLIALDAAAGDPCTDFGSGGQVSLIGVKWYKPGWYHMTSPPAVIDDVAVVGSAIDDNGQTDMPSGVVRAFDARTGKLRWSWDPIPQDPSDPAAKTWTGEGAAHTGAANAWSVMTVDVERDLVFVPTGSASPDYYGGERLGENKWANSVVAIRAKTGEVAWGFQLVHHDLWDYDTAAPPLLALLRRNGTTVPVVIEGNKTGNLFVLSRETGEPVFGVEERPVPQTDVAGEQTSPTQPFPLAPPPLVPQRLTADDAWGMTGWDRDKCRQAMSGLRAEGIFTPPSVRGSLIFPGNIGGMHWGGGAFDPERQFFVTDTNRLAFDVRLIPRAEYDAAEQAAEDGRLRAEVSPQRGTPFGLRRNPVISPLGVPCNPPPWGALTAVDMASGTIRWQVPLGSTRDLLPLPLPFKWGTPTLGGPITTAGGLVFIGATMDRYLRALDIDSGRELWKGRLAYTAQSTPMTYRLRPDGRQFVVIAAGGHGKLNDKLGDTLVAYALP